MKSCSLPLAFIGLAALTSGCRAQDETAPAAPEKEKKTAAPVGPAVIIPPQVTGLVHPYLLVKGAEIEKLRARFNDPQYADFKKIILQEADLLMTYNGEKPGGPELKPAQRFHKLSAQRKQPVLNILPWAYVFSGNKAYRDTFLQVMQFDFDRISKGDLIFDATKFSSEFTMVQFAVHAAFAYDLLQPELTDAQKSDFGKYLDQSLELYRNRVKASYGWSNNIGCIYFASSAIVAMARLNENPAAPAILNECLAKMKGVFYKASIDPHPDGGYPEGPLYRNFALLWNLTLVECYERTIGRKDHGLVDAPFYANSYRYIETMMGGDGVWMTFNDCQPQWYGAPSCAWLGARYDQPLMRWTADYLVHQYSQDDPAERSRGLQPTYWAMSFLFRDAKPSPAAMPALPTLATLPSLNIGTVRSQGTLTPGLQVGMKGRGENDEGHHQADSGSVVLYARGENVLLDPGYFLGEPNNHSLPLVDGAGPVGKYGTPLSAKESGDVRTLQMDSTADYQAKKGTGPERVRRSVVMCADKAVVMLDDILPAKGGAGAVENNLQAAFATEVNGDGRSAIIKGKKGPLQVLAFGPAPALRVSGPQDFGKSWIFKRKADAGAIAWHRLTATYTATADKPLVWVLLPAEAAATAGVTVEYAAMQITVKVPGQAPVVFERKPGAAWVVAAKGA